MAKKESSIKSFVLRVDTETMDAIEKWAADEFRSTNGQLQWIIAEALRKSGRLKKKSSKTGNKPEESEGEQVEDYSFIGLVKYLMIRSFLHLSLFISVSG